MINVFVFNKISFSHILVHYFFLQNYLKNYVSVINNIIKNNI